MDHSVIIIKQWEEKRHAKEKNVMRKKYSRGKWCVCVVGGSTLKRYVNRNERNEINRQKEQGKALNQDYYSLYILNNFEIALK